MVTKKEGQIGFRPLRLFVAKVNSEERHILTSVCELMDIKYKASKVVDNDEEVNVQKTFICSLGEIEIQAWDESQARELANGHFRLRLSEGCVLTIDEKED